MIEKQITNQQIAELESLRRTTKHAAVANRVLAILLLVRGGDLSFSTYSIDHARRLKYAYLARGVAALEDNRKNNRDRILSKLEREVVVAVLKAMKPKDVIVGCEVEHWTTGLLGLYIAERFGKRYKSKTSEYLLFREANFSWHYPGKSYEKADPEAKIRWIREMGPVLVKHWVDDDTVILCEDEMVLTSRSTIQKVWLPKGQYPPVIETNTTRRRKNFYGFLNLKTGAEHAFVTEKQNMGITAGVLANMRAIYPTQKLVIAWDNCGWHRGSKVTEWIDQDGNTQTIHFPPYTPQLNPQEHVWKAGRAQITHNQYLGDRLDDIAEQFKQYITGRTFAYTLLGMSGVDSVTGQD